MKLFSNQIRNEPRWQSFLASQIHEEEGRLASCFALFRTLLHVVPQRLLGLQTKSRVFQTGLGQKKGDIRGFAREISFAEAPALAVLLAATLLV